VTTAPASALDAWIATAAGLSRGEAQSLIERGLVTLEGAPAPKSRKLAAGETVQLQRVAADEAQDTTAPFAVAYEDEHLAVIVKPPGVVVHPAPGNRSGTLVEALGVRMPLAPAAGAGRPGIVHRLDKDTSGLMVVAKTDRAYEGLVAAMAAGGLPDLPRPRRPGPSPSPRAASRRRWAAPLGAYEDGGGVRGPGGRDRVQSAGILRLLDAAGGPPGDRPDAPDPGPSRPHPPTRWWATPSTASPPTLLARQLGLKRPFLHSHRLQFVHPVTGAEIDIVDPLPPDLATVLRGLEASR